MKKLANCFSLTWKLRGSVSGNNKRIREYRLQPGNHDQICFNNSIFFGRLAFEINSSFLHKTLNGIFSGGKTAADDDEEEGTKADEDEEEKHDEKEGIKADEDENEGTKADDEEKAEDDDGAEENDEAIWNFAWQKENSETEIRRWSVMKVNNSRSLLQFSRCVDLLVRLFLNLTTSIENHEFNGWSTRRSFRFINSFKGWRRVACNCQGMPLQEEFSSVFLLTHYAFALFCT